MVRGGKGGSQRGGGRRKMERGGKKGDSILG